MLARRRVSVTPEGWYFLFVVVFIICAAVMREVNVLVILAGMLLGPWLLHWRLAGASLRQLRVERRLPQLTTAGQSVPVQITVHNQRRRRGSWCITVEDRISPVGQPSRQQQPIQMLIPYVAAGSSASSHYHWMIDQRGEYELSQIQLQTRFPFGLLQSRLGFSQPQKLLVGPQVGELTSAWDRLLESDRTGEHHARPLAGRTDGDYYAIRPWRTGDSRRWIHWRSTARLGKPVVKQFERQEQRQLFLLLDLADDADPAGSNQLSVELAASLAMTVVHTACRQPGGQLLLTIAGQQIHNWSTAPSRMLMEEVASLLATIQPGAGISQPGWQQQLAGLRADVLPVVISTRSQHAAGELPLGVAGSWIDCSHPDAWHYLRLSPHRLDRAAGEKLPV